MKKKSLEVWIFAGVAAGILTGIELMGRPDIVENIIKPFDTLFLGSAPQTFSMS